MIQTTAAILRDRIRLLEGKEFTLKDILYDDGSIQHFDAFARAAPCSMNKFSKGEPSEVVWLRTERAKGFKFNVYKENVLKVVQPKYKRVASEVIQGDIVNWKGIYPEMFTLPKFTGNKIKRTHFCVD